MQWYQYGPGYKVNCRNIRSGYFGEDRRLEQGFLGGFVESANSMLAMTRRTFHSMGITY
jgi:hypothetical protein